MKKENLSLKFWLFKEMMKALLIFIKKKVRLLFMIENILRKFLIIWKKERGKDPLMVHKEINQKLIMECLKIINLFRLKNWPMIIILMKKLEIK
jgi:hypothetical protein